MHLVIIQNIFDVNYYALLAVSSILKLKSSFMSALSIVCDYGSTSDESDSELEIVPSKKLKLQLPDLSNIAVVTSKEHADDATLHDGRIRSFPHVRGNWASFVYVKYVKEEAIHNLYEQILNKLTSYKVSCHKCDDFHISLSKTVVLKYHLITSFRTSLQEAFADIVSFELEFASFNIYCNEDKTRTFISLQVDHMSRKKLLKLTQLVDNVLKDYKLPLFYEVPSFHMSILWLNGNKKTELTGYLDELNLLLRREIENNNIEPFLVKYLNCRIGNKYFQFSLQQQL